MSQDETNQRSSEQTVGVIGAGLMGSGIAQVAAQAGWQVVLRDVSDEALARGIGGIETRGYKTADDTVQRAKAFAEDVGKTCVVVNRDVAGFVTTRLIAALANEAARLVESGVASAEDVDTACRLGFGHPMGLLQTLDLAGIDILVKATGNIYDTRDSKFAAPELLLRMVAAGGLGRKSGRGFDTYDG